jgi:ribosomal protein S18 acetylase RimI-like enzyme
VEPRDWNTLRDRAGVGIDLWVEPRARRGGIGAALVDALAAGLAARGAPRLLVDVAARNGRARGVFARLGFRETMIELTRELAPPVAAPRARRKSRER